MVKHYDFGVLDEFSDDIFNEDFENTYPECTGDCENECSGHDICPLFFKDEDYRYDDPDYHEKIFNEDDIC